MARKTTRAKDNGQEFLETLRELSRERSIDEEILFEAIEQALITAYKRNFGSAQNVRVTLSRDTGHYHVYALKTVVEDTDDEITEISLAQARTIRPEYEVGDVIEIEVTPANFGRVAAQTAKQVVVQRIREAERGMIYEEFQSRESDILTGLVQRVEILFNPLAALCDESRGITAVLSLRDPFAEFFAVFIFCHLQWLLSWGKEPIH